jgi:hypothetical protein
LKVIDVIVESMEILRRGSPLNGEVHAKDVTTTSRFGMTGMEGAFVLWFTKVKRREEK